MVPVRGSWAMPGGAEFVMESAEGFLDYCWFGRECKDVIGIISEGAEQV